jgi:uroporphyrinogen III methyltransferase/synthase
VKALGKVWLVGAGPGDPGLLTVKGKAILEAADTVVHDRLVGEEILLDIPPAVRLIDVGKSPGRHHVPQEEINRILISEARKGRKVVRLKGGDPFIFGRGGEELLCLGAAGIPCELVPGVSAATGVPAAAGIPLTHRGLGDAVHIIAWHGEKGAPAPETLKAAVRTGGSLVILMGAAALRRDMGKRLLEAGFAPDTPAALVQSGSTPEQKIKILTLDQMGPAAGFDGEGAPLLIAVGAVCALAEQLSVSDAYKRNTHTPAGSADKRNTHIPAGSVDKRNTHIPANTPLGGKRIVVTRPEPRNGESCRRIRALGGRAVPFPCIKIIPSDPLGEKTFREAESFPWIVFTSATAVEFFFDFCLRAEKDLRLFKNSRFAVLGPATAAALKKRGFIPDFMPALYSGQALGEGLVERIAEGERVLLARARQNAPGLSRVLRERGVSFEELPLYDTIPAEGGAAARNIIEAGRFDYIFFLSPSAVSAFAALFPGMDFSALTALCIGESTAEEARNFGMAVRIPAEASAEGLCRLAAALAGQPLSESPLPPKEP